VDLFRRIVHIDKNIFYDTRGLGDVNHNSFDILAMFPSNINTMFSKGFMG
jgi:hypothetical protein